MLTELEIDSFRLFDHCHFHFRPGKIIFQGENGVGKTSILESIFFLANLRSFRTLKINEICSINSSSFRIRGCHEYKNHWKSELEVQYSENGRGFYIDHIPVGKASDFTGRMRCITFLPEDPLVISGTSVLRRRFFDMFIALFDKEYFLSLQNYSTALRSRNFLLKNNKECSKNTVSIIDSYNSILSSHGSILVKKREDYMNILAEETRKVLTLIRPELADFQIRMRCSESTKEKSSFQKKLEMDLKRDLLKGYTNIGPHQDEFDFTVDERSLRSYGSRGQLRTVSFALKLAQYNILNKTGEVPQSVAAENIVLVDDVLGDLDRKAKEAFFTQVGGNGQIYYTFTQFPEELDKNEVQIWKITDGKAVEEE